MTQHLSLSSSDNELKSTESSSPGPRITTPAITTNSCQCMDHHLRYIIRSAWFVLISVIATFSTAATARSSSSFTVYHDSEGLNEAKGIAYTTTEWDNQPYTGFSLGISANSITSNLALERDNRHEIFPVYLFLNLSLDYSFSPFIETGMDFGDFLLDKLFDGDGSDVDIYYSYGFRLSIQRKLGVSIYHKTYQLYFNELYDPTLQNVTLDFTGVGFSYYF